MEDMRGSLRVMRSLSEVPCRARGRCLLGFIEERGDGEEEEDVGVGPPPTELMLSKLIIVAWEGEVSSIPTPGATVDEKFCSAGVVMVMIPGGL